MYSTNKRFRYCIFINISNSLVMKEDSNISKDILLSLHSNYYKNINITM